MMNKYIIGIDIGGTKIAVLAASANGKILKKTKFSTTIHKESRQSICLIIDRINDVLRQLRASKRQIAGIGVCAPGPVDPDAVGMPASPNLPGWKGLKLKGNLKKEFKVPVVVGNDANAAALAVKCFGEGKKEKNLIYLTVSTGVGGGIIVNNHLVLGAGFCAGEVGHMAIVDNGPKCGCGKFGCLEALASGTAIAKMATVALMNKKNVLKKYGLCFTSQETQKFRKRAARYEKITAKEVKELASKGDRVCARILVQAGTYLGMGIANLMNILNPSLIALGGSVLIGAPLLIASMRRTVRKKSWAAAYQSCVVKRTLLGGSVNDLGAIALYKSIQT